jgi:alpha-tubulin suppressor-like RCC1 family protein
MTGVSNIQTIATGFRHTCVILNDGTVKCVGSNGNGELGNQTTIAATSMVPVFAFPCGGGGTSNVCGACLPTTCQAQGVTSGSLADGCGGTLYCGGTYLPRMAAGQYFTCSLLSDGTAKCWGNNSYGETGSSIGGVFPSPVQGLTGIAHLASGDSFACALLDTNEVRCWGNNTYFQLSGNGFSGSTKINPGLTDVRQLSAGQDYACARLGDGGVSCWGRNQGGQLGNGFIGTNSMTPQSVTGL